MSSCLSPYLSISAIIICVWRVKTSSLNPRARDAMFSCGGRNVWCQQDNCCRGLRGKGHQIQLPFGVEPSHTAIVYGSSRLEKRRGTVRQAVRGRGIPWVPTNTRVAQMNWQDHLLLMWVCGHEKDVHEACCPNPKWVFWVPPADVKMP